MARTVRPLARPTASGRVLAVVLLVLAAICLIAAIAGAVFARQGWGQVKAAVDAITARFKSGEGMTTIVVPGEATLAAGEGAIVFVASASDTVDGKTFTYPPRTAIGVTITDAQGVPVSYTPFEGNQPPIDTEGGQKFLVGFAQVQGGTYTIAVDGGETAIRAFSMPTKEFEGMLKGGVEMVGGGAAGLCGGLGFLLFGIIGAVLFFFGKRKPAMA